jgi:tetratricopeptide (TPR) repeat protein
VVLVAGGVAAAVVIAWAGVEIGASWSAGEARERLAGEPAAAAAAAERASSLAPWDDTYFRMTAECLERAASGSRDRAATLARAEEAARRAVALAPERASNHLRLASVLAGSLSPGDSVAGGAAAAEFERSLALAPTDGVAWMELARLDLYLGRPQAALAPAERALTLYPSLAGPEVLRARAWLALGERDRAVMALERALAADWQGRDDERRAASDLLERVRAPSGGTR